MLRLSSKGDYSRTIDYLKHIDRNMDISSVLDKYGQMGVERLSEATPVESGETRDSWEYDIIKIKSGYKLNFYNTNKHEGYHIVVLLRYGHVTVNGTWIEGNDFVEPVMEQLYDELQAEF